ncbi:AbrB family transcriptional regulator [Bacillus shivajii]|uniref:AbrB family transcriptional regulator n=1 Tax=Bacillus shivajii TaxID=1983719 RepID=UPI001CFBB7B6|nr:AbrB family transcriptional regulator [Bacillus shivajii]UCZ54422.1 AbrB family transcriptional regulator [Bacillus shivajii]
MNQNNIVVKLIEPIIIGVIGGYVFSILDLPLPWVLGALTFILLWQGFTKRKVYWPESVKNIGLTILGIYFGLYFTKETFMTMGPYFAPFVIVTIILIFASILLGMVVTKWINVDKITSTFASIPGGLTEMVIASESLNAKASLVVIFQTVRLLTVLFTVPALIIFSFSATGTASGDSFLNQPFIFEGWKYLWFIIPAVIGVSLKDKLPAGIVIIPLVITALMNVSPAELATVPPALLIAGQVSVGIGLGMKISFEELKLGGKYCGIYAVITFTLILLSFGLGFILAQMTSLNLATAMLSVAPGGLIEMVLTASIVGGDPAIVSALQLTRLFLIILFVPPILKWYFRKTELQHAA